MSRRGWTRITDTYEQVTARAERKGRCPGCGRVVRRSMTFTNTISPFNKNPDGSVRTPAQVQANVDALAAAWDPDPERFRHGSC